MSSKAQFSVHRKIASSPEIAVHGQVVTKPHVVELILDLVGYVADRPLHTVTLLDPGCGDGAFVIEAAKRLLSSLPSPIDWSLLRPCLMGIDTDPNAVASCRKKLAAILREAGASTAQAASLTKAWVTERDFLDSGFDHTFDFVVGNPPYVRQEGIAKERLLQYRRELECFYDRADLYVAFFERGLRSLAEDGVLGFICPDRFTRNNYGKKLRNLITTEYAVRTVIDLCHSSPFETEVIAYPGIFIVARADFRGVDHFRLADAGPEECEQVKHHGKNGNGKAANHHRYEKWFTGERQWTTESPAHLELLHKIEKDCVPLGGEASGCRVGIGAATGADRVFIVRPEDLEIERELLMPLVMTDDIETGEVQWKGRYLINPFLPSGRGQLIDLKAYPLAKRYFEKNAELLKGRNVAQRSEKNLSGSWYRTIDRIHLPLQKKPKLLIPDIKVRNLVVLEEGKLYPHHNLYFVTSEYWDLSVLQTILRSSVAKFFVWMYGVKMRGNFLRFQAQYLRRICIPPLIGIRGPAVRKLKAMPLDASPERIDAAVQEVYGLTDAEMDLIRDLTGG